MQSIMIEGVVAGLSATVTGSSPSEYEIEISTNEGRVKLPVNEEQYFVFYLSLGRKLKMTIEVIEQKTGE